ncbi:hypothetical protein L4X63_15705 [Geomonas sp. Red32]|uniref:hypothetical protein n=1 Tax=Geomonas sp. Red32 TaxID=2912856 RepID=UPI00202CBC1C|nr:hypothetical protein [Geomonas sp. Red32]MCM0083038.1 hypothetical protein [Geomonas sp. Red32]
MKQQFRLFIVTAIFAVAVFYLLKDQQACLANPMYSGLLGNVLATLFAAFMVWVAWEQWSKLSQTSSADFIHRLTQDFFTSEARTLMSIIDCGSLKFVPAATLPDPEITSDGLIKTQPYFTVDLNILKKAHLPQQIMDTLAAKAHYSAWEIDDFLLSPLEDVGMLETKGIVSFDMVYSGFSYYLQRVFNYNDIRKYINSMRQECTGGANQADLYYYGGLQYIATKCEEYEGLHKGFCKWWWLLKRQFLGIQRKRPLILDVD